MKISASSRKQFFWELKTVTRAGLRDCCVVEGFCELRDLMASEIKLLLWAYREIQSLVMRMGKTSDRGCLAPDWKLPVRKQKDS